MLESLARLGRLIYKDSLDHYVEVPKSRKKRETLLVKVIFDIDNGEVTAQPVEFAEELAKEYLWVGHTLQARNVRIERLTVKDPKYLRENNNVIINICDRIEEFKKNGFDGDFDELYRALTAVRQILVKNDGFNKIQEVLGKFEGRAVLYTICVKRGPSIIELAKTKGYEKFLKQVIKMPGETSNGTCYLCGQTGAVLPNPAFPSATLLKIYVTDKKGFMSNISDSVHSMLKTFSLCPVCREQLIQAWNYVENNLKTSFRGLVTYLIPSSSASIQDYDRWSRYIKKAYDAVTTFEGLMDFDNRLQLEMADLHMKEEWYSVSIVFAERGSGAHFELKSLIQDVPLTRLSKLREVIKEIEQWAQKILGGEQSTWSTSFNSLYDVFPLHSDRNGKPRSYRPLLELFHAILAETHYPYEELVAAAVRCARIHRHQSYLGFNIRPPKSKTKRDSDIALCKTLLKYNLVFNMLRSVGVMESSINGGSIFEDFFKTATTEREREWFEVLSEWFKRMEYMEHQQALFLLGCLVAKVGNAQYAKNDKKKSILDKIDFNGMGAERVMELAVRIFKSLRDYRILSYNEKLYHIMKALLDKNLNMLRRNPLENVFYILSGYAYETNRIITSAPSSGGASND